MMKKNYDALKLENQISKDKKSIRDAEADQVTFSQELKQI